MSLPEYRIIEVGTAPSTADHMAVVSKHASRAAAERAKKKINSPSYAIGYRIEYRTRKIIAGKLKYGWAQVSE